MASKKQYSAVICVNGEPIKYSTKASSIKNAMRHIENQLKREGNKIPNFTPERIYEDKTS